MVKFRKVIYLFQDYTAGKQSLLLPSHNFVLSVTAADMGQGFLTCYFQSSEQLCLHIPFICQVIELRHREVK